MWCRFYGNYERKPQVRVYNIILWQLWNKKELVLNTYCREHSIDIVGVEAVFKKCNNKRGKKIKKYLRIQNELE